MDSPGFWREVLDGLMASSVASAAVGGAVGGVTSALAIKVPARAALRQIAMGALVAGGTGSLGTALLAVWFPVNPVLVPAAGAGASASYFVGVFGPAIIEVMLRRIKGGRLPGDGAGGTGGQGNA